MPLSHFQQLALFIEEYPLPDGLEWRRGFSGELLMTRFDEESRPTSTSLAFLIRADRKQVIIAVTPETNIEGLRQAIEKAVEALQ